jgi:drug/metabolite transporter superfamily protein YnfA
MFSNAGTLFICTILHCAGGMLCFQMLKYGRTAMFSNAGTLFICTILHCAGGMLCFQMLKYGRTAMFSNAGTLFICTILFYPTAIRPAAFVIQYFIRNRHFHFSRLAFLRQLLPF